MTSKKSAVSAREMIGRSNGARTDSCENKPACSARSASISVFPMSRASSKCALKRSTIRRCCSCWPPSCHALSSNRCARVVWLNLPPHLLKKTPSVSTRGYNAYQSGADAHNLIPRLSARSPTIFFMPSSFSCPYLFAKYVSRQMDRSSFRLRFTRYGRYSISNCSGSAAHCAMAVSISRWPM